MAAEAITPPTGSRIPARVAQRWLAAVPARHARRSYTGEPVAPADLDALEELAASWSPWSGARVVLVREAPQSMFVGIVGAYGGIIEIRDTR